MQILRKVCLMIIILFLAILISGCNDKNEENELKDKVIQEIEFLDSSILSIVNKLNNISFENYTVTSEQITIQEEKKTNQSGDQGSSSDEKPSDSTQDNSDTLNVIEMVPNVILVTSRDDVDWQSLKNEIELINSSWAIIVLDLYDLVQNNSAILEFSDVLSKCILSIKDENKIESLKNISTLYSYVPKYSNMISDKNSTQNIKQVKSYVINAYSVVEQGDWNEISKNLEEADKSFQNIANDIEYNKDNQYKVNKAYIILKDLQASLINQDKDIFYMKYKSLMETLNVM